MDSSRFQAIIDHVARFTVPIGLECHDGARELRGTGTIVTLRDKPYLLTCDHVARERLNGSLAIGMGRFTDAKCAINPIQTGDSVNDIAMTRLAPNTLDAANKRALPRDRMARTFSPLPQHLLLVHGFPGFRDVPHLRAQYYDEHNLLRVKPLSIVGPMATLPTGFDDRVRFAIPFHPDQLMIHTGGLGGITPDGLSGSGVWQIGTADAAGPAPWPPLSARLIGMAIEWVERAAVLICLRVEVVRRFLLLSIRQEAAYFKWLERGQPASDSWFDWFWAESSIREFG